MIRAIVTDIEGTTSSIRFVKEVLFPYAHERIAAFVQMFGNDGAVRQVINEAKMAAGNPTMDDLEIIEQLKTWITEDKKVTPLKTLQGLIWAHGYKSKAYAAHMYPDAVVALKEWHAEGLPLYIYSSGSIKAQQLFFNYSEAGDLTPLLTGYFDTTTGPKQSADSYKRIALEIGLLPEEILFLSDIREELDAAKATGMHTYWLIREGSTDVISDHPIVTSFADIELS